MAKKYGVELCGEKKGGKRGLVFKGEFTSNLHQWVIVGVNSRPEIYHGIYVSKVLQLRFWAKYGKTSPPKTGAYGRGNRWQRKDQHNLLGMPGMISQISTSVFHRKAEEEINLNSIGSPPICRKQFRYLDVML